MRRLRSGTIVAFVGLGVMLGAIVASFVERGLFVLMIPGFVALFIGLGILANALMFTVPRKEIPDHSSEGLTQKNLDSMTKGRPSNLLVSDGSTNDLNAGERGPLSITEHTTHQLKTGR
jgi:hypothetical protein